MKTADTLAFLGGLTVGVFFLRFATLSTTPDVSMDQQVTSLVPLSMEGLNEPAPSLKWSVGSAEGLEDARKRLSQDPHSESAHYEVAKELFLLDRFVEALDELEELLAMNSSHEGAKKLIAHMKRIDTAVPSESRLGEILEASFDPGLSLATGFFEHSKEDKESVRRRIEKEFSQEKYVVENTTWDENLNLAMDTLRDKDDEGTLGASDYESALKRFPNSRALWREYVQWLLFHNEYENAVTVWNRAGLKGEDADYKIFSRGIQGIAEAKSTEQKQAAFSQMLEEESAWSSIVARAYREKARETAAQRVEFGPVE